MLEVNHLTIRSKENQPLVQDISFSLIPGQPLGLTGASGSGKDHDYQSCHGDSALWLRH